MKRILAIDDSATVRNVLQMTLEEDGYEVVLASDGSEALSWLSSNTNREVCRGFVLGQ